MRFGELVRAAVYNLRVQWSTYGRPLLRPMRFLPNLLCVSGVHGLFLLCAAQVLRRLRLFPIAFFCRDVLCHWCRPEVWASQSEE